MQRWRHRVGAMQMLRRASVRLLSRQLVRALETWARVVSERVEALEALRQAMEYGLHRELAWA
eukprot:3236871-Prymnesium_polylepis.1